MWQGDALYLSDASMTSTDKYWRENETFLLASENNFFKTTGHAYFSDTTGYTSLSHYVGHTNDHSNPLFAKFLFTRKN